MLDYYKKFLQLKCFSHADAMQYCVEERPENRNADGGCSGAAADQKQFSSARNQGTA